MNTEVHEPFLLLESGKTTSSMLYAHIHPQDQIIAVGPGTSVLNDATTMFAALCSGPGGTVYIADPLWHGTEEEYKADRSTNHFRIAYEGCSAGYLSDMDDLRSFEIPLASSYWLGAESSILHFPGIPNGSVQRVIDHGALAFVIGSVQAGCTKEQYNALKSAFDEVHRVLSSSGTYLLQCNVNRYGYSAKNHKNFEDISILPHLLKQVGFSVEMHHVDDRVSICVNESVAHSIGSWYRSYDETPEGKNKWATGSPDIIRVGDDQYIVQFLPKKTYYDVPHVSPVMFICAKQE